MKATSKRYATLLFLYLTYFAVHLWVYTTYVSKMYAYMGFVDELATANIPISILAIALSLYIAGAGVTPSSFFLHLAMAVVVIPSLVLYAGANLPFLFIEVLLMSFILVGVITRLRMVPRVSMVHLSHTDLLRILLLIALTNVVSIFLLGGARFLNFDLSAVYEARKQAATNLPAIFGYLNSSVAKVIIPFGIVIALLNRRAIYASLFVLLSILLFGLTGHKAVLFNPFVVLFVYYIGSTKRALNFLVLALIAIGAISAAEFYLTEMAAGLDWFSTLFERRVLLTPSLLNWFYIDWFSRNEFYFWADSKLSLGLSTAPSDLRSVNLIGLEYFGKDEMAANAGWIGSGYANAGIFGVCLYSFLCGLLLSFLDTYARVLGFRLVISLLFVLVFEIFTSTDIFTSLFTHGLLAAVILISFMRPPRDDRA